MPRWQDITLAGVVNIADAAIADKQRQCACQLSSIEKGLPKLPNLRCEAWIGKVINPAPDNLISGKSQKPARAGVDVQTGALAVQNQNGLGGVIEDRPKQRLQ